MPQQPGEWRGPWHGPVSSPVQRPVHPLHTARTLPERLAHDPHTVHTARTPARPRLALRRALSSQVDTGHQASFPSTAGGSRLHHLRHAPSDPGVRLKSVTVPAAACREGGAGDHRGRAHAPAYERPSGSM